KKLVHSADKEFLSVRDLATRKESFKLIGHAGRSALGFSPDGKRFASWGSQDRYLRVWDAATGKALIEHRLRPSGIDLPVEADEDDGGGGRERDLRELMMLSGESVFSHDGKLFVLGLFDGFRVFDVVKGKELRAIKGAGSHSYHLAISPDNKFLLAS